MVVAKVLGRLFVSFDRWIRRGHEVAELSEPNFSEDISQKIIAESW